MDVMDKPALSPLFDGVIIRREKKQSQTKSGLFLPEEKTKENMGTVVAIGVGARKQDGSLMPMTVKVGDKVLLPQYGVVEIKTSGDDSEKSDLVFVKESEILAIFG